MSNPQLSTRVIPESQLPTNVYWAVSVNLVVSTNEIWARIVEDGVIDPFHEMMEKMNEFYNKCDLISVRATRMRVGNYYAVYEDETWHRTRCKSIDIETGNITLFFIDHGSTDVRHCTELYLLEKEFYEFPAQALRLRLFGLEYAHDYHAVVSHVDEVLYGRVLFVKIVRCDKDENGPIATVVFYDTHGQEDINLNDNFTNHILTKIAPGPAFETIGEIYEVFISHVDSVGDVYVQMKTEHIKFVFYLLNRLIPRINLKTLDICSVSIIRPFQIYLVMVNENWFRAKILSFNYCNRLKVLLIDTGESVFTVKSNLIELEQLCKPLAKFPAQAKKVNVVNVNKLVVKKLIMRDVPRGLPILMKIDSFKENVPRVRLFKRIQPNDMLIPISDSLSSCRFVIPYTNTGQKIMEDDEIIRSLKPPKVPDMHVYFDVHVIRALNPDDFTIQPFASRRALHEFMGRLQDVYEGYKGPPLTKVKKGQIYAGRHSDGHWYRVRMLSVIRPYLIAIYFCDYGNETTLPLSKLLPLYDEFFEFPYQAIKARCAGIRPINGDWTPDDISRFKDLVTDKSFVSLVMSKPDIISNDTILGLKLIEVASQIDIRIDKVLVDEGRAVFIV